MNRFPIENIDKVRNAILADSASSASKLSSSKNISLSGDVSGSVSFDGSSDSSITATIEDDSHNHVISNIDNLQSTIDTINTALASKGIKLSVNGKTVSLLDSNDNVLSSIDTQDTNTTYTAGTGISISSNEISNTGVTSINGDTGDVTISIPDTSNLMTLSTNQTITGDKIFTTSPKLPSIEFTKGPTGTGGFIDFHYDQSTADYTSRIIESSSGTITIQGNLNVTGSYTGSGGIPAAMKTTGTTFTSNTIINKTTASNATVTGTTTSDFFGTVTISLTDTTTSSSSTVKFTAGSLTLWASKYTNSGATSTENWTLYIPSGTTFTIARNGGDGNGRWKATVVLKGVWT